MDKNKDKYTEPTEDYEELKKKLNYCKYDELTEEYEALKKELDFWHLEYMIHTNEYLGEYNKDWADYAATKIIEIKTKMDKIKQELAKLSLNQPQPSAGE